MIKENHKNRKNQSKLVITRLEFFIFWCAVLIQSLVWSRFLLSVGLWGIVIVALIDIKKDKNVKLNLFQWIFEYLQFWRWQLPPFSTIFNKENYAQKRTFFALSIPFFLVVLSGLWSENLAYWLSRVQLRLPFLLLPLAFSCIPPLSKKQVQGLLFGFLLIITANCVLILTNYAFNFEAITQNLGRGKAMPFLKEHITFSIMTAFGFFIGIELALEKAFLEKKWAKIMLFTLIIFLFIALHIIAVRTGILAFYIGLILRGGIFIFQSRRYIVGMVSFAFLLLVPWLSYQFLPSFQQRLDYTIWDFQQYKAGEPDAKSDSERIISLKIGTQLFLENKVIGVGFGDIEQEMNRIYAQQYPNLTPKLPHNQWLLTLVGLGIIGFVLSVFAFVFPLFEQQGFKDFLLLSLHIFIFVFSMTDIPFEASFSLSFYLFFACLFLNNRLSFNYENV